MISFAIGRIKATQSSTVSGNGSGSVPVNVAVMDTGVQLDRPDLNVVGGHNCIGDDPKAFDNHDPIGHGRMVAGFIGARDNAIGLVGSAPGARIWSVRSIDRTGFGTTSEIICGLDWVASTRLDNNQNNDIQVLNMSLGGPEPDDANCGLSQGVAFHRAVCGVTDLGVTSVVSAGNETIDFADVGPASFSEVLTVTAMADRDAMPGSHGGLMQCLLALGIEQNDDEFAFFSNYATLFSDRSHVVSAPGACISSTFPGSQYAVSSGTSFSAPLVSGVVALCIWSGPCAGLTPQQIVAKIVADATAYNQAHPEYGYLGDPQHPVTGRYYGYLVNAALY